MSELGGVSPCSTPPISSRTVTGHQASVARSIWLGGPFGDFLSQDGADHVRLAVPRGKLPVNIAERLCGPEGCRLLGFQLSDSEYISHGVNTAQSHKTPRCGVRHTEVL